MGSVIELTTKTRSRPSIVEEAWVVAERREIERAKEARIELLRALGLSVPERLSISEIRRIAAFDRMLEGGDMDSAVVLELVG